MIQVLHRAFDILELCAKNAERIYTLSEIADKLKLNNTTCANILKTLVARNYIEQVGYKKGYRLGAKAYHLTGNFSFRRDLVQLAKKQMEELVEDLNETCILSILRKTDLKRIVLHEVESKNELSVKTTVEKDAYNAATGRLLLAYLQEKEIDAIIEKFGMPNTAIWPEANSKQKLKKEFAEIQKSEIVFQYDRNHIVGLAIPIRKDDKVIASLGIYMPEMRYQGEMKKVAVNRLREAVNQITNNLADFISNQ